VIVLDVVAILLAAIVILFLPGLSLTYVLFKRGIDRTERLAFSFGLSVSTVTLVVFWLNWLFGMPITLLSASLVSVALTALPAGYLLLRYPSLRKSAMDRTREVHAMAIALCSPRLRRCWGSFSASRRAKTTLRGFWMATDHLLRVEPFWVLAAGLLVFLSYLLQWSSAISWVALSAAFLPFLLRMARHGRPKLGTPFDLPIALLVVGAFAGLLKSPEKTISLGAFQCVLVLSLFYYSWVNHRPLEPLTKRLMGIGVLSVAGFAIFALVESTLATPGSQTAQCTYHGLALCLLIMACTLLGMAVFGRTNAIRFPVGLATLAVCAGVILVVRESVSHLLTFEAVTGRLPRWEATVELLGDSPLTGLGLGCWPLVYHGSEVISHPSNVHNAYLELYSSTGLLGVLALAVFLVVGVKIGIEIIRSPRDHPWYGFGVGALLACAATLVVGVLESSPVGVPLVYANTYRYIISPAPWVLTGMLVTARRLLSQVTSW